MDKRLTGHSRPVLWGLDHLLVMFARPDAGGYRRQPRRADWAELPDSTTSRLESRGRIQDVGRLIRSVGLDIFFSRIGRVRTGNPVLRSLPTHAHAFERGAHRFTRDLAGCHRDLAIDGNGNQGAVAQLDPAVRTSPAAGNTPGL